MLLGSFAGACSGLWAVSVRLISIWIYILILEINFFSVGLLVAVVCVDGNFMISSGKL